MGKLKDRYIRFDWAIKRLLRDKANFAVLEGLLTVLFEDKTQIVEILESEGNQLAETDKFNRVDIKAKNSKGEIILVEVQNTREVYYLERILYGVAKTITEHISLGESYGNIKKVYSISIVYFDLGKGNDYLYHGQNRFIGVHTSDELQISTATASKESTPSTWATAPRYRAPSQTATPTAETRPNPPSSTVPSCSTTPKETPTASPAPSTARPGTQSESSIRGRLWSRPLPARPSRPRKGS